MKKFFIPALAAVISAGLGGCASETASETASKTASETASETASGTASITDGGHSETVPMMKRENL